MFYSRAKLFCFSHLCPGGTLPGLTLIVGNDSSELEDYVSEEWGGTGLRRSMLIDVTITFISFSTLHLLWILVKNWVDDVYFLAEVSDKIFF